MNEIGIEMARSEVSYSVDEALAIADKLGYPVVLRPAYTMGGAGGGLVYNKEELKTVCARGLQASLVGQLLNGGALNTEGMINAALAEAGKGTKLNLTV